MISLILRPTSPPFLRQTVDNLEHIMSSAAMNLDFSGIVVIRVNSAHIWTEEWREKAENNL